MLVNSCFRTLTAYFEFLEDIKKGLFFIIKVKRPNERKNRNVDPLK